MEKARTTSGVVAMAVAAVWLLGVPAAEAQKAVPRGGSSDSAPQTSSPPPSDGGGGKPSPAQRQAPPDTRDRAPRVSPKPPSQPGDVREPSSQPRARAGEPPPNDRDDDGQPRTGRAVPRRGARPPAYDPPIGFYPWGWGGLGFGGFYGGYYGPVYDPWYYGGQYYSEGYGELKLKVKPRHAVVYVDGYYVGEVDEFDGIFQSLHIEPGPHRIEIEASGYEPLTFDIRILPGRTITYNGELERLP